MEQRKVLMLCLIFLSGAFLDPAQAWAVQSHGGDEGLVVHQIGHVLFAFGMLFLLHRLHRSAIKNSGWFEFKCFLWLVIAWNILTFYEHWHRELLDPDKFIRTADKITAFTISTPLDGLFYFSNLDHLLLLPAFLCLMAALNKWRKQG